MSSLSIRVGSTVQLATGQDPEGCLRFSSARGTVVEVDGSTQPYRVEHQGERWWYRANQVVLADSVVEPKPVPQATSAVITLGSLVQLVPGPRLDADTEISMKLGCLKGSDALGKVVEIDGSEAPFKVEALDGGETWWYMAKMLIMAPPSAVVVPEKVVTPGTSLIIFV